jgi:hypothetical protein
VRRKTAINISRKKRKGNDKSIGKFRNRSKKQLKLQDLTSTHEKYFLKRKNILKSKLYELEVYDAMTAGKVLIGL